MYITAYLDRTDDTIHVWVSETMPTIPDDEEGSVIAVFDTEKPYPRKKQIVTRANLKEFAGLKAKFGDDSVSEEIDFSTDEHFGRKLRQIYYKQF